MTLQQACKTFEKEAGNVTVREELEARYGQVWDTEEMKRDFEPIAFGAPLLEVRRRSDKRHGSLRFQHLPRFYFDFQPYDGGLR